MKRKVNKKNFPEEDNFNKRPKKGQVKKDRSSKRRLSIYDDFEDEDLDDYYSRKDDDDFDEDDEDFDE
jgi:hypothetical protein